MNSAKKIPSPLVSLFPIAFLVGMLFATIHTFGSDALSGGSQISLLATTGMCVFIGMTSTASLGKIMNLPSPTTFQVLPQLSLFY